LLVTSNNSIARWLQSRVKRVSGSTKKIASADSLKIDCHKSRARIISASACFRRVMSRTMEIISSFLVSVEFFICAFESSV